MITHELRVAKGSPGRRIDRHQVLPTLGLGRVICVARNVVGAVIGHLWPALVLVALWQAWVGIGHVDTIVMPTPMAVGRLLLTDPGFFTNDLLSTLVTASVGLGFGTLLGWALAVAAYYAPLLAGLVAPPALLVRSVPIVAMVPVIASVLGYSGRSVLAVAVLISFFPAFVFVSSGLRCLPRGSADLLRVLGGSRWQRVRRLALPAAMPNLFTSVRISAATCVLGALVAEYLLGTKGLGNVFLEANQRQDTPRVWAVAVIASFVSVVAFLASSRVERWAQERWT